jgi:collagen type III alpha
MASGQTGAGPAAESPDDAEPRNSVADRATQYEQFIGEQLRKTRWRVKSVDLVGGLLTLAAGAFVYLLALVLVDHWVVAGGLGFRGRLVAFSVFIAGGVLYAGRYLLPIVVRKINPVFAAQTIERSQPSLKNSLVNFLLLRSRPQDLPPAIYDAIEQRAATDLTSVSIDTAVDHSRLMTLGYVMTGIVAFACLYKLVSPKDPLRSMGRVIDPWANIAVPTRVTIRDVKPGNTQTFIEKRLTVSTTITGLGRDEPVTLFYSTADGQTVNQPLKMSVPDNDYVYKVELPDDSAGLQQDVDYSISAGDATTPRYHVRVVTVPSILVERVDYKYPAYSEIGPRTVERQGDLQGLEGTLVTIKAEATHDIKSAYVDFERDGKRDLTMAVKGRAATVTFPLEIKPGTIESTHPNYQLLFTTSEGDENLKPIEYKIDVIADLPPEVALVEPKSPPEVEQFLSEQGSFRLAVEAQDPDFKLAAIRLVAERNGKPLLRESLLSEPRAGKFHVEHIFDAKKYRLQSGDRVVYWAEADDNKKIDSASQPGPNRTATAKYTLKIVSPDRKPPPDQLARAEKRPPPGQPPEPPQQRPQPDPRRDRRPDDRNAPQKPVPGEPAPADVKPPENQPAGENNPNQPQPENQPPGDKPDGQAQERAEQRVDPEADPGKAIDEINKHFEEQQKPDQPQPGENPQPNQPPSNKTDEKQPDQKPGEGKQSQSPDASQSPEGSQSGSGEQKNPGKQGNKKGGGDQASGGDQGSGEKKEGEQNDEGGTGRKSGQQAPADPSAGGKQSNGDQKPQGPGNMADPSQGQGQPQGQDPGNQGGQKAPGGMSQEPGDKTGEQPPGKQGTGQQQPGQKQPGQPQPGQQKADEKNAKSGASQGKQANKQPGEGQPGEKQPAGSDSPGDGKTGKKAEPTPQGASGQQPGANQPAAKQQPGNDQQPAGAKQSPGGNSQPGEKPDGQMGDKQQGDKQQGGKQPNAGQPDGGDKKEPGASPDQQAGKQPGASDKPGKGDQAKDDAANGPGQKPGEDKKQPGAQGGDPQSNQSSSGAGKSGDDNQGAPSPHEMNQGRDKQPDGKQGKAEDSDSNDDNSPSRSPKQSNSKGQSGGDQSGGGKAGGGQKGNQPGTGGPGQNTASDEGGSKANEKGAGDTSGKGGDQQPAGKPTDNAQSDGQGSGSKQQSGGKKPGAADNPQQKSPPTGDTAQSGQGQQPQNTNGGQPPANNRGDNAGPGSNDGSGTKDDMASKTPGNTDKHSLGKSQAGGQQSNTPATGGGVPGEAGTPPPRPEKQNNEPGGEDPNLEYARKATDMALEKLKDQMQNGKPDQELLDKLKWTPDDVERFVKRWEQMKQAAKAPGPQGDAAREKLDETLRSLGLRPHGSAITADKARGDRNRNLRETMRTRPPAEYADQYRAYSTGTSQSRDEK